MRNVTLSLLVLAMLAAAILSVSAQNGSGPGAEATPEATESPDDNACYTGGSQEGKCDWPTDDEDEWAWTCGWYIARYDTGEFGVEDIPEWCGFFVNPVDESEPTLICYYSDILALPEFTLTGPISTLDNATFYVPSDEHICSVPAGGFGTVVDGETAGDALATCEALLSPSPAVVSNLSGDFGYVNTPGDWYACEPVAT